MPEPLSKPWDSRAGEYDVVIIGSGYGGAITAARLAMANITPAPSICVLERGMEWIPGTFPDEAFDCLQHFVSPLNPLGLYEFVRNDQISVIKGSGLGGTSLVNANVAIRPEAVAFEQDCWPEAITLDVLKPFYDLAAKTLQVAPHPRGLDLLKIGALKKRGNGVADRKFDLLDLAVNFTREGVDENGVERHECNDCGDSVTGCNRRAKNTVYMNYLPLARKHGVEIFTQVQANYLEALAGGGYLIHFEHRTPRNPIPETGTLRARRAVVLAGGALGSTEIMLRSRQQGMALPDTVGTRFSGNGDFFGIAYNSDQQTDVMGFGNHPEDKQRSAVKAGPTIVGVVRYNRSQPFQKQMTFEDLSVPRAAVDACRHVLPLLLGTDTDDRPILDWLDNLQEAHRVVRDVTFDPKGALNHTMAYLVMADDDAKGTMSLSSDHLKIDWPQVGAEAIFEQIDKEVFEHAKSLGAKFIGDPVWNFLNLKHLITAHPLGGCPMGDSQTTGLVDDVGRVFKPDGRSYSGLRIADGSIIPNALGVNPFLTISALSERIADNLIQELQA
jgi:cholesterol oxidase